MRIMYNSSFNISCPEKWRLGGIEADPSISVEFVLVDRSLHELCRVLNYCDGYCFGNSFSLQHKITVALQRMYHSVLRYTSGISCDRIKHCRSKITCLQRR